MDSSPSLRDRALTATTWRAGGYVAARAIQLAGSAALAHYLSPAAFGLTALADVVLRGLRMFSDVGIGQAIIQSARWNDRAFLETAWTIQIIRGGLIWVIAILAAYPVSVVYAEPALAAVIPVLGTTLLFRGLQSTAIFTQDRQLQQHRKVVIEICQDVIERGGAIAWALVSPTVWAIVAGSLAGSLFVSVTSHLVLPSHRHRVRIEREALRSISRFGRWIFIGTVIAFFSQQIDRLLLGRFAAIDVLGVYAIAMTFAYLPRQAMAELSQLILLPILAEAAHIDPATFRGRLQRARSLILPTGLVAVLGVTVVSPWFFYLVYDERYQAARWLAPLAGLTAWTAILNETVHASLTALGATRPLAFSGAIKLITGAAGCVLGFRLLGLSGVVLGFALGEICQHASDSIVLRLRGTDLVAQDLAYSALLGSCAAICVLAIGVRTFTSTQRPDLGPGSALAAAILVLTGIWAGTRVLPLLRTRWSGAQA